MTVPFDWLSVGSRRAAAKQLLPADCLPPVRGKGHAGFGIEILNLADCFLPRDTTGANWNRPDTGSLGGVSWLVRGPRKNLTKTLIAKDNSFALAA